MHRIDTHEPIFWRTPGYPPFLALFYRYYGISHFAFDKNWYAQCASLWVQILCASFIPLLLFYCALLMTNHYSIAWLLAVISMVHPGFVLASTYLLSEGLALIFFYLFLLFLFKNIVARGSYYTISAAALMLGIYTWMRPMGEFIGYVSALLILCAGSGTWSGTAKKSLLFILLFVSSLAPWYWRNYQLTHEWFFCPTLGNYLICFSVPKILRRTLNKPLLECHGIAQKLAQQAGYKKLKALQGTNLHIAPTTSKTVAIPLVMNNPGYFVYDWFTEIIKTTFDLYSYQMVAMVNGSYWYDPLEEFLLTKIADTLYAHPVPWYVRFIAWVEFLGTILVWIGLCGGLWHFLRYNFFRAAQEITADFAKASTATQDERRKKNFKSVRPDSLTLLGTKGHERLWLVSLCLIGTIIGMTGGFGYARLRLPAEPLLIILSLTWWVWFTTKEKS